MLGKTNANIQKGTSGATVTAVNKTGEAINQGDKVWINNGSQIAGNHLFNQWRGFGNASEFIPLQFAGT